MMYHNLKDRIDGVVIDLILAVFAVGALYLFGKFILWMGHKVAGQ